MEFHANASLPVPGAHNSDFLLSICHSEGHFEPWSYGKYIGDRIIETAATHSYNEEQVEHSDGEWHAHANNIISGCHYNTVTE